MLLLPVFQVDPLAAQPSGAGGEGSGAAAVALPRTPAALAAWPGGAAPFKCGVFPQAADTVDYTAWWAARPSESDTSSSSSGGGGGGADDVEGGLLPAPYFDFFEPVGVAAAAQLPRWDERFRGYGLNKVQLGAHLAALGFQFKVSAPGGGAG
jgi:hypothetical protein